MPGRMCVRMVWLQAGRRVYNTADTCSRNRQVFFVGLHAQGHADVTDAAARQSTSAHSGTGES